MRPFQWGRWGYAGVGVAVLVCGFACSRPSEATKETLVVRVGLQTVEGTGATAVPLDQELRTGDLIRLTVQADRQGYLYLYHRKRDGTGVRLWPVGAGAHAVDAGELVTLPGGTSLRLTGDPGRETLLLYFAREPVADPNSDPVKQIRLRAIELAGGAVQPTAFAADLDARGIAVLEIGLHHR